MRHRQTLLTLASCSLAAAFLLAGCPPTQTPEDAVTITYEQVGACNGYQQTEGPGGSGPQHTVNAGPKAAFVAFRIVSIDNTKNSKDFKLEPHRFFVNQDPQAFMDSSLTLAQDLGVFTAVPTTVPKGKSLGNHGVMVTTVSTAASNGSSEANNVSYFLSIERAVGDPVFLLSKKNPNQTSWPQTDNCRAIQF